MISKPSVNLGIDMGDRGYICILYQDETVDFISTSPDNNKLFSELSSLIENYTIESCIVEEVRNIFGASSKSNFKFGYNVGFVEGVLFSLKINYQKLQPKEWHKYYDIKEHGKKIKHEVAYKIKLIYPEVILTTANGTLQDGKSDSLALAGIGKAISKQGIII